MDHRSPALLLPSGRISATFDSRSRGLRRPGLIWISLSRLTRTYSGAKCRCTWGVVVTEARKIAAILVADIVGYSRLMGAEEEVTLERLRALRNDVFDPAIEAHAGRVVSRAGDGAVVEFRSVVEAVRCAIEITKGLAERNAPLPPERRIEIRIGVHLGDVIETQDGDLFGDAVNIAARLESICAPGGVCLSEDAWRQVRDRLPESFVDLGEQKLKNIVRPMRVYALSRGGGLPAQRAVVDQPAGLIRTARAIPAAAIGVIESVARLTDACASPPDASGETAKRLSRARKHSGLAKAVGILETVERIVDVVTDRTGGRDVDAPDPPQSAPGARTSGREATPERRRRRNSRGRDDTDASSRHGAE